MKDHFAMMAAYNAWANYRLMNAIAEAPEDDFRRDTGVFFESLRGTLNHLYVTDTLWMARLRDQPAPHWGLNALPHPDRAALAARRRVLDRDIQGYVLSLGEAELETEVTFTTITNPAEVTMRRSNVLTHLFNHQTHHRGQAHACLTTLGHAAPPLDLLLFLREG